MSSIAMAIPNRTAAPVSEPNIHQSKLVKWFMIALP
jgi:hypothetical protein